ncbi:MAG: saccharopine dehydrogenase, partial [Pseudorhodobacter sp.]
YLVDEAGRRVAAFGYWAGYAGAAVALKCWAAQQHDRLAGPVAKYPGKQALLDDLGADLAAIGPGRPRAIVIGALGRVGTGAADLCEALGVKVTKWDMAETAQGGPFPQVLAHEIFLNCILARPGCPVFVPKSALTAPRDLTVIGDIACDPTSEFSPIKVYDRVTSWAEPALRVAEKPVLDVTAIDNLPSLLPVESSEDFAGLLLPSLLTLDKLTEGVWGRAKSLFETHIAKV